MDRKIKFQVTDSFWGIIMIEIVYLGLGIIALFILNTVYIGWRGSQLRKAEAKRDNPLGSR